MWRPTSRGTQMEPERVTEDDKKQQQRRWKCDNDHDDDGGGKYDEDEAGNVDSGFLSGANLQFSGEISGDSGLLHSPEREEEEGRWGEGEGQRQERQAAKATTPAPSSSSSSSSTAASAAIAHEEPMRAIDSGVDLDLTETLSQLSLKQVSLNPLAAKGKLIQAEPTAPELLPVSASLAQNDEDDVEFEEPRDDGNDDEKRATTSNEEPAWQLYYTQDDDGDTQLHIAIVQGFVEAALCLIRMAPDPCLLDTMNDDWQSPMHLAVLTHQPLIVRRLVLAGADPSLRNFRGNTALHLACMSGDFTCAKALTDPLSPMERNKLMPGQTVPALPQNLEQRNYSGEMCLHVAAANGYVDLVRLLLRLGADLKAKEGLAGYTALHLAVERQHRPLFDFLLPECQRALCLDERTYGRRTAYQLTLDIKGEFSRRARRELIRHGAHPEPLSEPDSDSNSESSEDEETMRTSWTADYLSAIKTQNAVGVTV
ncbi:NF-kappa-B inhibitor cactus-like [Temnothorax curvispinosus]|uniref:NF-kappa-B inhibitor cactus-like n=1 Tax=Temnothorax curvispinosus TaxID=300111 RepID=A0A6J1PYK9_9HYME|nr:NF-kappa-B inhibitor cactus-like [Temnothorax curvispinosus]